MGKTFLCSLIILLVTGSVLAQQTATGTVFLDANRNGTMDSGERGLAEVPVSNGREVVLTDNDGTFFLPIDEDDGRIFIIKPSGYQLPINEHNLPQFYYLYKPGGSPDLEYQGVEPTGELPESVNFPLFKKRESEKFSVLVFGDPQPSNKKEVDYFDRDIISELHNAKEYAFGISLGDLVHNNLDLFKPYNKSITKIGIPWFNVYGNHDMNFDAKEDRFADETFEATFGPTTYSFNQGKAHFIILDDVIYPRKDGGPGYVGGLTDQQLTFIENDLKFVSKDHLVILAFHIPLTFPGRNADKFRQEDQKRLLALLKDYPNTLSLSAHTHVQGIHFLGKDEGWKGEDPHIHYNVGTTCGDWWSGVPDERDIPTTLMRDGTPNGYAILKINGNEYTIDYKVAGNSKDSRMSIWGPNLVPKQGWSWHKASIYVNYFLGSVNTKVEYQLPGESKWGKMNRVEEQDPFVASIREKWDTSKKLLKGIRPSNPSPSTHLWKAPIPNRRLSVGQQSIRIRVTDIFGRVFEGAYTFEVIGG